VLDDVVDVDVVVVVFVICPESESFV